MIRVGIGGWTFAPWRGVFFPEGLAQARELHYASRQLTAIEVNGTYYSTFKPPTFAKWRDQTPDGFVFTIKASRYCTNRKVLAEAAEPVARFAGQGLAELGDKLGPILWQFMPTKRFDPADFQGFLDVLPREVGGVPLRHALEVRHASFACPEFVDMARRAKAAVVFADGRGRPVIAERTSSFAYVRLMDAREEVDTGYDAAALDGWADLARSWARGGAADASAAAAGNPPDDVFVFMINGAKVRAPAAARALLRRLD